MYGATSTLYQSATLGVIQGDAMRNLTGALELGGFGPTDTNLAHLKQGALYGAADDTARNVGFSGSSDPYDTLILDASRQAPVAVEIRPVNMAVRFLVKALK